MLGSCQRMPHQSSSNTGPFCHRRRKITQKFIFHSSSMHRCCSWSCLVEGKKIFSFFFEAYEVQILKNSLYSIIIEIREDATAVINFYGKIYNILDIELGGHYSVYSHDRYGHALLTRSQCCPWSIWILVNFLITHTCSFLKNRIT